MQNTIKYNQESYLFAKRQILSDKVAENTNLSVPEVCDMAAKILLAELYEYDHSMEFNRKLAFHVLSTFSKQLQECGKYEFGKHDALKLVSEKHLS